MGPLPLLVSCLPEVAVPAGLSTLGINSGGLFQCFSTSFGTRNVCSEARGLHFCFFSCFYSDVEASVAACC